jgi:hypothetical protein
MLSANVMNRRRSDVSTPMERLAMYECAVAQVFALCSLSSMGYDGLQHFAGPEGDIIRVRLYWYTFVHEGITSGLKGGRLVLDEDDLESFQASLPQGWALVGLCRKCSLKYNTKQGVVPNLGYQVISGQIGSQVGHRSNPSSRKLKGAVTSRRR